MGKLSGLKSLFKWGVKEAPKVAEVAEEAAPVAKRGLKWGLGKLLTGANVGLMGMLGLNEYNTARQPGGIFGSEPGTPTPEDDPLNSPARYLLDPARRYEQERQDVNALLRDRDQNYQLLDNTGVGESNELLLSLLLGGESMNPIYKRRMLSQMLFGDPERLSKAGTGDIPKNLGVGDPYKA